MNTLALVVLSAALVHAGAAPKPGDCDAAGSERMQSGNVKPLRAQQLAEELVIISGIDSKASLKRSGRDKTLVKFYDKDRFIEGSPAVAAAAGFPPNNTKSNIIVFTTGLLEFAQNESEAAFILAHEVSHLAGEPDHAALKQKHAMALADKYISDHPEVLELAAEDAGKRIKDDAAFKESVAKYSRTLEDEADINGLNLMGQLKDPATGRNYDRAAASDAMRHAKAWLECVGAGGSDLPDVAHDPLEKRIALLQERAAQFGGASKKVDAGAASAKASFR